MSEKGDISRVLEKKRNRLEKLLSKLITSQSNGAFYRFTLQKRNLFLSKIQNLRKSVSKSNLQLKLAALGGTVAALSTTQDAVAQSAAGPFIKQSRAFNPLRYPLRNLEQKPSSVDLDNDGDYDIVVGDYSGYIRIFLNEGTATAPAFTDFYALDDLENKISIGYKSAPVFADLNADGNLDLIVPIHDGSTDRIRYFVGNGGTAGDSENPLLFTEQIGPWNPVTKAGNPFDAFDTFSVGDDMTLTFVNFDQDADLDVVIGHSYSNIGDGIQMHYFENTGNSVFDPASSGTLSTTPSIAGFNNYRAAPQFADLDGDGNDDLVFGNDDGVMHFFKGDGANNFNEQTGTWDPVLKTGNPFDAFPGYLAETAPSFIDLDSDGDLDLVLGHGGSYKYSGHQPLAYLKNEGNAVFQIQEDLSNPFDGTDLGSNAVPFFVDADDNGDLDVLIGGKYNPGEYNATSRVVYLKNNDGIFVRTDETDNPFFAILEDASDGTAPNAINLDGDPDLEVVAGSNFNGVQYFDKSDGEYVKIESEFNPLSELVAGEFERLTFGDIDGDGDLDAFIGGELDPPNERKVVYLKNTGSSSNPVFTPLTGVDNPLDAVLHSDYAAVPILVDIDNDGDLDAVITENGPKSDYGGDVFFFENTGTPTNPIFTERTTHAFQNLDFPYDPQLTFIDFDKDGDVDFFVGGYDGRIQYYVNSNPSPTTALDPSTLTYSFGSGPIVIDANLILADSDGDLISRAEVSIQNFQPGDEALDFTAQSPITGFFNTDSGVLTLQGLAPIATYQAVLRTVTYDYTGADPGARKRTNAGRAKAISRTVDFAVLDADLTTPSVASRTINVASGGVPPTFATTPLKVPARNQASVDLAPLVTDADGNFDPQAPEAFSIITQPQNGTATISGSILNLNYADSDFVGSDVMQIQVCDVGNVCSPPINITILVGADFIVYNGISPNGDPNNEIFYIEFIDLFAPENKVSIFNRWGDKVFEVDNNNDKTKFSRKER